jgi:hypothetical protein
MLSCLVFFDAIPNLVALKFIHFKLGDRFCSPHFIFLCLTVPFNNFLLGDDLAKTIKYQYL